MTVNVEYTTQGSMFVDVPEGTSEEDVANALVDSIAETLDVHPSTIKVDYNPSTGEVIYTITSEDAETLSDIASIIEENSEEFEDDVNANLASEIDGMSIKDVTISPEIVAEIEVIVDATDVLMLSTILKKK